MRKPFVLALVLLGLGAGPAAALDIKDVRSTYGPFGGVRTDNKFLPGDYLFLSFHIDGLTMQADTGLVKYKIKLEVVPVGKDKAIFTRDTPNQRYLSLGGAQLSERAQVVIGTEQAPGKYVVRLTVTDTGGKEKGGGPSKAYAYDFEILPPDFGLIHRVAPSVAKAAEEYTAYCAIVGMARDAKQMPNLEIRLVVRDENGKATLPKPLVTSIPKDLPPSKEIGEDFDIKKQKLLPLPFPLILNRPGLFTVEIEAIDLISKKTAKVSFPLKVLETSAVGGK